MKMAHQNSSGKSHSNETRFQGVFMEKILFALICFCLSISNVSCKRVNDAPDIPSSNNNTERSDKSVIDETLVLNQNPEFKPSLGSTIHQFTLPEYDIQAYSNNKPYRIQALLNLYMSSTEGQPLNESYITETDLKTTDNLVKRKFILYTSM